MDASLARAAGVLHAVGVYLVQLLLPLPSGAESHGARAGREIFERTRSELTERFGGVTAYMRSPAEGRWRDPSGEVAHDDVIIVEVMCEELDRSFWAQYRRRLAEQLGQQELIARALPIESL